MQPTPACPAPTCCWQRGCSWLQLGAYSGCFLLLLCCPLRFQSFPLTCLWEGFLLCGNFSSFTTPSPGQVSFPKSFVSVSSFIFCPTSFQIDRAAFLDVWCPLPVFRSCFVEVVQMIFWWICGEESDLPFLFLCHLGTTPPVFSCGEFHEHRGLIGYSPWGHKELDTTEWLSYTHTDTHTHTHKEKEKKIKH